MQFSDKLAKKYAENVESVDAIIKAHYDVVSSSSSKF